MCQGNDLINNKIKNNVKMETLVKAPDLKHILVKKAERII